MASCSSQNAALIVSGNPVSSRNGEYRSTGAMVRGKPVYLHSNELYQWVSNTDGGFDLCPTDGSVCRGQNGRLGYAGADIENSMLPKGGKLFGWGSEVGAMTLECAPCTTQNAALIVSGNPVSSRNGEYRSTGVMVRGKPVYLHSNELYQWVSNTDGGFDLCPTDGSVCRGQNGRLGYAGADIENSMLPKDGKLFGWGSEVGAMTIECATVTATDDPTTFEPITTESTTPTKSLSDAGTLAKFAEWYASVTEMLAQFTPGELSTLRRMSMAAEGEGQAVDEASSYRGSGDNRDRRTMIRGRF